MIKNVEKIDDLKFNLNDDMSNMIIEILITKQKLKESSLSKHIPELPILLKFQHRAISWFYSVS